MMRRCRNEVEQLHQFFTDWFTGNCEDTDANFARVSGVLAPAFRLISPRGAVDDRDSILRAIRAARAGRAEGFRIWIEAFEARFVDGPLCVVCYQEWQQRAPGELISARWSTAVFRDSPGGPNRVQWLHLQETWLPDKSPDDL